MAKHRYWRAVGLKPYDGGATVEITELWLLNGATRADLGATLTSSIPPISGSLSNLQDGNPATIVTLAANSTITWDLGVATEITNFQVGAGDSVGRFPLGCGIERSDDGVVWREYQLLRNWMGIRWPGARALTANVLRIPPISHLTIRMSFEPASWWLNEFGPAASFAISTGAAANTASPIKGARSIEFSGNGMLKVLSLSAFAFPANTDFTIQARVRATSATAGNRIIATFGGTNIVTNYVTLALDPGTGVVSMVVSGSTTRGVSSPSGAFGALNVNRHVAGTSENGVLRLFIDGVLVATTTGASTLGSSSNPDVAIGSFSGTATNTFLGVIDEVGIDQKALYFNDFTPPAAIVPQPEWLIDAATAASALNTPILIPSGASIALPYGQINLVPAFKGRNDYVTGTLGAGVGRVRGFTLDYVNPLNKPYACRVRLVRETDGLVVREQWSKADGSYDFQYIDELQSYTVLAYYLDHGKRAVVTDGLTLANGKVEVMA